MIETIPKEDCIESENKENNIDLLEYLKMDKTRLDFVADEGWKIRCTSKTDGEFLKNLIENKTLDNNEKLMTAYKVGTLDGDSTDQENEDCDVSKDEIDWAYNNEDGLIHVLENIEDFVYDQIQDIDWIDDDPNGLYGYVLFVLYNTWKRDTYKKEE